MGDDLGPAVQAVAVALDTLSTAADPAAVTHAIDQAHTTLTALDQDPTTQALKQLLVEIRRCHHFGLTGSHRLEETRRAVSTAVQGDPRCADLLADLPRTARPIHDISEPPDPIRPPHP